MVDRSLSEGSTRSDDKTPGAGTEPKGSLHPTECEDCASAGTRSPSLIRTTAARGSCAYRLFTEVRGIGILGSRTRSKSQQFVTDPRTKRSIRGGAEGQILLATPGRSRGAGQGGADCYSELRRIPISTHSGELGLGMEF